MNKIILPGATLGVLGGGQLGRMFCTAARSMGYRTLVLDPDQHSPAGHVADIHLQADFQDQHALARMAAQCDVITTEFENIPADTLRFLARSTNVFPSPEILEIAQNRQAEKQFALKAGLTPVPYFAIESQDDCTLAQAAVPFPAILKTTSMGYDGKGQQLVRQADELMMAFQIMGKRPCVLEKKIKLSSEISVIVARNADGDMQCFPVSENQHIQGILHTGIVPARINEKISERVKQQALKLAQSLNYIGILAVEFFVENNKTVYFNEMAPRPHNSGHYTNDACVTSQFEQQVRMICGLPPGDTRLLSPVVMVNMLGDLWEPNWWHILQHDNIKLHLYGKNEARQGRKMGHYNVLDTNIESAIETAQTVFSKIKNAIVDN